MYKHHISAMVEELTVAGVLSDRTTAETILTAYWQDKIALVWTTMDFDNEDKDENWQDCITHEQAIGVLQSVLNHHDCSYGVTWQTIHDAATDALRICLPIKG